MSESFEKWLKLRGLGANKEGTISQYARFEDLFLSMVGNGEVNQEIINDFCAEYNHPVSRAALKRVLEFAKEKGTIKKEYIIPKFEGRKKKRLVKYLLPEEIEALIRTLSPRNRLIVLLCYDGGLRISEVLSLKKKNIDLKRLRIRGIGKGNKEYVVNFSSRTKNLLEQHMRNKDSESKLFLNIGRKWAWELLNKAGLKYLGKKVTPHMFRHSIATYLYSKGWREREMQEYLRHEKLDTVSIYTHIDRKKLEEKYKEDLG